MITKFFTIDTETLSLSANGKILSISFGFFDLEKPAKNLKTLLNDGDIFHMNFDVAEQNEYGLITDESTHTWWKSIITREENPEARKRIVKEIHNGKSKFKDFDPSFRSWLSNKIDIGKEKYYVFERQLGFDRERFAVINRFAETKPQLDHWTFADTRTWIRKSNLPESIASDAYWNKSFEDRFFDGFPHIKHHSVDDCAIDGFMIKMVVQKELTKL